MRGPRHLQAGYSHGSAAVAEEPLTQPRQNYPPDIERLPRARLPVGKERRLLPRLHCFQQRHRNLLDHHIVLVAAVEK